MLAARDLFKTTNCLIVKTTQNQNNEYMLLIWQLPTSLLDTDTINSDIANSNLYYKSYGSYNPSIKLAFNISYTFKPNIIKTNYKH